MSSIIRRPLLFALIALTATGLMAASEGRQISGEGVIVLEGTVIVAAQGTRSESWGISVSSGPEEYLGKEVGLGSYAEMAEELHPYLGKKVRAAVSRVCPTWTEGCCASIFPLCTPRPISWEPILRRARAPIFIRGDGSFTPENGVVRGQGAEDDPYVIEGWRIEVRGRAGAAIYIADTSAHFIIRDCEIDMDHGLITGVNLNGVRNGTIESLLIHGGWAGIGLADSSENTVSGNLIRSSELGVYLSGSSNNRIAGNIIEAELGRWAWAGVYLERSTNNVVSDNRLIGLGITLYESSGNLISRNVVQHSNAWHGPGGGITLLRSMGNEIAGNTVLQCELGISLRLSAMNLIYHNNLLDNELSGYDDGFNFWDDGRQGNYWSDYSGQDVNGDGVGDAPYIIPGAGNADRYPLVSLWRGD